MEKYNFDVIFAGTHEENGPRAADFVDGLKLMRHDAQKWFAKAVLSGGERAATYGNLADLEAARRAFFNDPRTKALMEYGEAEEKRKREDSFRAMIHKAVEETVGRG